jgi:hypothetical protein
VRVFSAQIKTARLLPKEILRYYSAMSSISGWWNLRRLQRRRREIPEEFAKKEKEYRLDKTKTSEDYNALQAEEYYEERTIEEAVNKFISIRLYEQATKHDVEIPPPSEHPDYWRQAQDGDYQFLSAKGRAALRDLIRAEKDRKFEEWAKYAKTFAPIIGAIAGLIGVLTGLVAVLKK